MSHFSDIGFTVTGPEDIKALSEIVYESGKRYETEHSYLFHWPVENGAALWLSIEKSNNLVSLIPDFVGSGRMKVGITKLWPHRGSEALGGLYLWAKPDEAGENPEEFGRYPFVVDVPNFDLVRDCIELPSVISVQTTAFAEEVTYYDTIDAFEELQKREYDFGKSRLKLKAGSFISAGLFRPLVDHQPATGYFAAEVLETEEITNSHTGIVFEHALVNLEGDTLDVVIDPSIVPNKPTVGGIVQGTFWLSGHIVEE